MSAEPDGPSWVEVEGTVQAPAPLLAPVTGLPCVLYRVELGLLQRLLEGGGGHAREIAGARFRLRTGDDTLLVVDASHGQLRLRRAGTIRRKVRLGRDPALDERLLQLYRRLERPPPCRATVVCRERRLQPGERVRVSGELFELPAPGGQPAGYRQPPRQPLLRASLLRAI